mmetsp:Transcript_8264/g.17231  ORF Transcript_8264/g.17231 Transcript_8264/m.17231 type:complete len:805 (-) Transcript_8264:117-2531(-)
MTVAVLGDGIVPLRIEPNQDGKEEVSTDFTCSLGDQNNVKARVVLMNGHKTLNEHYFKQAASKKDTWPFSGNGDKFRTMIIFCDELEYKHGSGSKDSSLVLSSADGTFFVSIDTPFVAQGGQPSAPNGKLTAVHCLTPLYGMSEPHWVIEYMEHHLAAGVSHLHIYNYDLFTPELKSVFEEYQRLGVITYHDWSNEGSGLYTQNPTYEHAKWTASTDCLLRSRGLYDYALFGDIDEVWLGDTTTDAPGDVGSGLAQCQKAHEESNGAKIGCCVHSHTMTSVYSKLTSEEEAKNMLLLRRYSRSEAGPHCPGNCECLQYGPDPNGGPTKVCLDMYRKYAKGRQKYIVNTRDLAIEPRPLFTHAISRDNDEMDRIMEILPDDSLHVRHYQGHWLARKGLLETLEEKSVPIPDPILNKVEQNIKTSQKLSEIYNSRVTKGVEWITPIDRAPILVDAQQQQVSSDDDGEIAVEDELAAEIVRGAAHLPDGTTDLKFRPGTLPLKTTDALQICYSDKDVYKEHFRRGATDRVSVSEEHKLIYVMLPKSGSSTARFMMENKFGAREKSENFLEFGTGSLANYTVLSFIRDPLSRFFSQYDEAYARTGPWQRGYRKEDGYTHPAPYLFENLGSYRDYEDIFCPPETRSDRKECTFRETQENGTLAARLERYAFEYDGRVPFDIHLHLQVPLLSFRGTGRTVHIDEVYNTTAAKVGWESLAKRHRVDLSAPNKDGGAGVIQGRSYPRRFDKKYISDRTKQRICELGMLDYCCLNLPLPPPCSNLYCRLDEAGTDGNPLRIQPWSHPESKKAR